MDLKCNDNVYLMENNINIYTYLTDINSTDKFKYGVLILLTVLFMMRLQLGTHVILGVIVGVFVVYYLNEKSKFVGDNFITDMKHKLDAKIFEGTTNMHHDSEIVELLYSLREYRYYSPANMYKLVHVIDKFLRIVEDMSIGTKYMGESYEIAREYRTKALNTLHSFVYKVPHTPVTIDKFHMAMKQLETLLNNHLDRVYQYMVYSYGK